MNAFLAVALTVAVVALVVCVVRLVEMTNERDALRADLCDCERVQRLRESGQLGIRQPRMHSTIRGRPTLTPPPAEWRENQS